MQLGNDLSPQRRELMLKIWHGYEPFHAITGRLFYLEAHFPNDRLDDALRYLVRNRLTGKSFIDFVEGDCAGSNLEMHRRLIAASENEKKLRKLFAWKDVRL